jgi:predicted component of type VI protein secretion system
VSKVHAVLDWDGQRNRYLLTHRSATNPTLVNGIRLTRARHIDPGDRVQLGRLVFELRIGKGQHAEGDIDSVDVAQLTRSAAVAAAAPEMVTWIGGTPMPAPAVPTAPPAAPLPARIPPPARKALPTPVFDQPYAPVPVQPAALGPTCDVPQAVEVDAEAVPAVTEPPRRIALTSLPPIESEPAVQVEEIPLEEPVVEAVVEKPRPYKRASRKIGRNEKCPCGSGVKYKKCCGR